MCKRDETCQHGRFMGACDKYPCVVKDGETGGRTESRAMRHMKHAKAQGIATACTAHHVNFGGACLNCGFNEPEPVKDGTTETLCGECGAIRYHRSDCSIGKTECGYRFQSKHGAPSICQKQKGHTGDCIGRRA